MKKVPIIIMLVILFFITLGCSKVEPTKMISSDYINKNNGIVFNNYAFAIDQKDSEKTTYAVYKEKSNNRYKKIFTVYDYSKEDQLLATNEYLYIFNKKGGFIGYKLTSTLNNVKKVEPEFESLDGLIYFPIKIYGFSDNYIYISYYKDEIKKEVMYAKIEKDLSSYETLESEKLIPADVTNYIKK